MPIECKYLTESGVCLLKSIYVVGHERHVHPTFCLQECGPEDTHKLGMLNNAFNEILLSLPTPEEAQRVVNEKKEEYLRQQKMLTLLDKAKDLGQTVLDMGARVLTGQSPFVSEEEKKRRQDICERCEKYLKDKERCGLCGCFMNIKNWILDGRCKLGKWDSRLVSVLIVAREEKYLDRTIQSVKETATNPIELVVVEDVKGEGQRTLLNKMAEKAKGDFLFVLDSHCILSPSWDGLMKFLCGPKDLVCSRLVGIKENTWELSNSKYDRLYINPELQGKWWDHPKSPVSLTMATAGCSWMMTKKRFKELGGFYNDFYSPWGAMGSEISLKVWLSGGTCVLRQDVICGHLFRKKNPFPVNVECVARNFKLLQDRVAMRELPLQDRPLEWLIGKFDPVPEWYGVGK